MSGEEYLHPKTGLPREPNGGRAFLIFLEARVEDFALGLYENIDSDTETYRSACRLVKVLGAS
jgi:hypothetical protein